jgi:hypothetical protein
MWENPKENPQMFKLSHTNTWCVNRHETRIMLGINTKRGGQCQNLVSFIGLRTLPQKHSYVPFSATWSIVLMSGVFSSQWQTWSGVDILLRWGLVLFGWIPVHKTTDTGSHKIHILFMKFIFMIQKLAFNAPRVWWGFWVVCFMQIQLIVGNM